MTARFQPRRTKELMVMLSSLGLPLSTTCDVPNVPGHAWKRSFLSRVVRLSTGIFRRGQNDRGDEPGSSIVADAEHQSGR